MGAFLSITVIMTGIGIVFVLLPLFRRPHRQALSRKELNAAIYRARLSELQEQHRENTMEEAEFVRFQDELRQSAFSDLSSAPEQHEEPGHQQNGDGKSHEKGARGGTEKGERGAKPLVALLAIAIPVAAFGLYFQLGNPEVLMSAGKANHERAEPESRHQVTQASVEDLVERLATRLQENPDDPKGWIMLGRSYRMLGRAEASRVAFAKAYGRWPDNPEILIGYAEALAGHNSGNMAGKPLALIQEALRIAPDFPPALWLAGVAAYQQDRPADAVYYWERLEKQEGISEQERQALAESLAEARQRAKAKTDSVPD
uniref:Cytochrome c-type biogenesis protein CcmH n=1 Tax=Candidatus Kentrum sp. MB TaxID=2138164 RepID=A0A450Y0E7_9GAMM|nr:MAG: cytochrome c-type biogenesis protein CcmH [Candidatus Kentron sp. MB]VFK77151.1 MAG: cytochrome c-type biogenesis protein CcmH [Candidatus Kentron sp. MB]